MRVNLHTHSNISDGILSPKELVNILHKNGVEVFALTDHDTIDGLMEARKESDKLGLKMINGIEVSCNISDLNLPFVKNDTGLHLLGLDFDINLIKKYYSERRTKKRLRIQQLVQSLNNEGYKINVNSQVDKKTIIAESLVTNGYANNIQDAFNNIINHYYDKKVDFMTVKDAIEIIHKSNGKAIWAHPYDIMDFVIKKRINRTEIELLCTELSKINLDGIETYYEPYNNTQIKYLKKIQEKYKLISSVGTDYHGKDDQKITYLDIDEIILAEVLK